MNSIIYDDYLLVWVHGFSPEEANSPVGMLFPITSPPSPLDGGYAIYRI